MLQERASHWHPAIPYPPARRKRVWAALLPQRGRGLMRVALSAAAALTDLIAIAAVTLASEAGYRVAFAHDTAWPTETRGLQVAALLSLIIVSTNALRGEYTLDRLLIGRATLRHVVSLWFAAWAVVLVIGFLTKTTTDYSRLVSIVVFVAGLPTLFVSRLAVLHVIGRSLDPASPVVSRVHLVGYEEDIHRFYAGQQAERPGLRVVGTSYLRRADPLAGGAARLEQLQEDLDLAVSVVRFLRPDDVFVLVPWTDAAEVERCIDAFLRVPAALHLRPGAVLDRFPDMQVARVGRISGINIGRRPLNLGEIVVKRCLDVGVALVALVLLAPLLALVAIAIKVDSPGPVFFRQRRYGFNQQPFDVFKFRSMKVDHSAVFRQATRNDSRITRIGAILRKTNIDELPQLLNVILGEMSLVGPRPHALAHDRSFERRIALYARRHNVKPGITGWAQVNGLRGETLTDQAMAARVEHDLRYIDNWSIWFDIHILILTVVSRRAYRNAF
jgi:Undecaprenyl-phosphate glucose phosphotransferase